MNCGSTGSGTNSALFSLGRLTVRSNSCGVYDCPEVSWPWAKYMPVYEEVLYSTVPLRHSSQYIYIYCIYKNISVCICTVWLYVYIYIIYIYIHTCTLLWCTKAKLDAYILLLGRQKLVWNSDANCQSKSKWYQAHSHLKSKWVQLPVFHQKGHVLKYEMIWMKTQARPRHRTIRCCLAKSWNSEGTNLVNLSAMPTKW